MRVNRLTSRRPSMGRALLFSLILILGSAPRIFAQGGADRASYNQAVDKINCETIRFIHREVGRAEDANNLDCSSYESINKSIPEDESGTTGKVAKEIEAYKSKFVEGKPLADQIDAVIKYANGRITAKKRKQNVEDFKLQLENYKQEALSGTAGTATPPAADGGAAAPGTDEQPAAAEQADETAPAKGGSGWLPTLSLILALAGLGLSAYLFTRLRAIQSAPAAPSATGGGLSPADSLAIRRAQATAEEVSQQYKRLENKMYEEINRLTRSMDQKIDAATASPNLSLHEAMTERAEAKPAFTPPVAEKPAVIPPAAPVTEEEEEPVYHQLDINEDGDAMMMEEEEEVQEEEQYWPEEDSDIPAPVQRPISDDMAGRQEPLAAQQAPAPEPAAEPEPEGDGMPFYLYAGEPVGNSFPQSMLKDAPAEDSLFEIELYEDVPNKAFFSLLPYPEVIKKALSDPDRYLAPCFTYTEDPAGRRAIVLVEEGMLRREGDRWVVYEKARIRFE